MKKTFILMVCFLALISLNASAKIWRVNSAGLPADFTTIQAAHDAATVVAGDTLHMEPSMVSYGRLISTKKLIILGPGYFLDLNANQQANLLPASIQSFTLNEGSSGTVISGLTITEGNIIATGNIMIMRNRIIGIINLSGAQPYSNVLIFGNYMDDNVSWYLGPASVTNIMILNNYIKNITLPVKCSGVIANNIITHHSNSTYNFTIKNNICTQTDNSPYFNGDFNMITNNICSSQAGLPAGNSNQTEVPMSNVFVGLTGHTTDSQYQLKEDSPAIGKGLSGEDCGMFGGSTPYHLSGLPDIPSIYKLSAPSFSNGNTLPVTISVKTNN
jgi:hypothetical protein